MKPEVWKLKKGADRRIRSGHPWVFSNEIENISHSQASGAPIVLQDFQGQVVALGYGNTQSQISFRALSFSSQEMDYFYKELFILNQILKAWKLRLSWGFKGSFRMVFGESDFLPGIVIDYYKLKNDHQVLAVQILSAGLEKMIPNLESFFKELVEEAMKLQLTVFGWNQTTVVLRNDVGIRKLEGLKAEAPRVIHQGVPFDLSQSEILLNSAFDDSKVISLFCDLLKGQKTGFF